MEDDNMTLKLSIVVPSYNAGPLLAQLLDGIYTSNKDLKMFETIVVDSSDDDTIAHIAKDAKYPIKLVKSKKRLSCGEARNIGARAAVGEYIWTVDADDLLAPCAVDKVLSKLDGKDFYFVPWRPLSGRQVGAFIPKTYAELMNINVAAWNKVYKRLLYVDFPNYHPEDVVAHYKLLDKVDTFSSLDEVLYIYNDTNPAAITRTIDWLRANPTSLIALAQSRLPSNVDGEIVAGVLKTAADLYSLCHSATKQEVKRAAIDRLRRLWMLLSAGYFVH